MIIYNHNNHSHEMEAGMKIKRMLVAVLILVIAVMIASRGCRGLRGKGRHAGWPFFRPLAFFSNSDYYVKLKHPALQRIGKEAQIVLWQRKNL
jgi:hypothetical protein